MDPPITRVPGTAVFLNSNLETTPLAMRANVERNKILHESVVVVSIRTENVPHVGAGDRLDVDDLGFSDDGIAHRRLTGLQDIPDLPGAATGRGRRRRVEVDVDDATYFLSQIKIVEPACRA